MKTYRYMVLGMVALALGALACGLPGGLPGASDTPAPAREALFQDDFADDGSGWDTFDDNDGRVEYKNEKLHFVVSSPDFFIWSNANQSFDDVILEVEVLKFDGPDANDMGVICRYSDNNNFYYFTVGANGYYGIFKMADGEQTLLTGDELQFSDAITTGFGKNTLHAECVGETLSLSVNGTELASVTDDAFTSGDVGLMGGTYDEGGVDLQFDNFIVYKP